MITWEVESGTWEIVPGGGEDGRGALLASGEVDGGTESVLELAPNVDLTGLPRPMVSFDIDYLEVHPNHTLNLIVESDEFEQVYRVIRFQNFDTATEGFNAVSVPIFQFANADNVRIRLQVVRPQNAQYSFDSDNWRIHERPQDGTGCNSGRAAPRRSSSMEGSPWQRPVARSRFGLSSRADRYECLWLRDGCASNHPCGRVGR